MKIKMFKKKFGFTLIELLVVISIIGILVAMGAVAFTTAQRRGRDARRRGDMEAMQKAFEQYYADNTAYSATCSTMATGYLPGGIPSDPQPGESYDSACSATAYCICATLEATGTGNSDAPTSGSTSCNYSSSGDYFCLSNLQ